MKKTSEQRSGAAPTLKGSGAAPTRPAAAGVQANTALEGGREGAAPLPSEGGAPLQGGARALPPSQGGARALPPSQPRALPPSQSRALPPSQEMDLTVGVCVWNAAGYVEETLRSVCAQTRQDFRLLVVDDCSTDGSAEVVERFFREHPRQYELVRLPENGGIAHARNFVLHHATTKYVLFLDSDDLFDPRLAELEYDALVADPDLMGVSCWSKYINAKGKEIGGGTFLGAKTKDEFIDKASRAKLIFLPIHTMFDRELAIRAGGFTLDGFPEGRPRMQDYCEELDLWTRMSDYCAEGKAFITLPKVLYYYRKSDGLSSNHYNMIVKMRYTKANLRRRRRGDNQLTFVEFCQSLTPEERKRIKKDAFAAQYLRNGVFYLKRGRVLTGAWMVARSVAARPGYFVDKLRKNLLRK